MPSLARSHAGHVIQVPTAQRPSRHPSPVQMEHTLQQIPQPVGRVQLDSPVHLLICPQFPALQGITAREVMPPVHCALLALTAPLFTSYPYRAAQVSGSASLCWYMCITLLKMGR